jgi:hypothetical protein
VAAEGGVAPACPSARNHPHPPPERESSGRRSLGAAGCWARWAVYGTTGRRDLGRAAGSREGGGGVGGRGGGRGREGEAGS